MSTVLDMDGPMADFVGAANAVHGRPGYVTTHWNWFEDWGMTEDEFWAPIHALGNDFYGEWVKPQPWLDQMLTMVAAEGSWCVITAADLSSETLTLPKESLRLLMCTYNWKPWCHHIAGLDLCYSQTIVLAFQLLAHNSSKKRN